MADVKSTKNERIAALEAEVAALRAELALLRRECQPWPIPPSRPLQPWWKQCQSAPWRITCGGMSPSDPQMVAVN